MPAFDAPLSSFAAEATAVAAALRAGDERAAWRVKWHHPRFHGRHVREVRTAPLTDDDARLLVAREEAFTSWDDVERFVSEVAAGGAVAQFEATVDAVVDGRLDVVRDAVSRDPAMVRARSTRRHHATLLHYLGANGVEAHRQRTPPGVLDVARLLLDAGADPDALADLYDERCTTLSMVVSSRHPAEAGQQLALAQLLLDRGASPLGPGSKWQSAILTALVFGYLDTARGLAGRGGVIDDPIELAGLGRLEELRGRLHDTSPEAKQAALALAAQLGHAEVVALVLAAGADPNRYNPEGFHAHAAPLHHAAWHGHLATVERLVEAGARLDLVDTIYDGTPLDWAVHASRGDVAALLRSRA